MVAPCALINQEEKIQIFIFTNPSINPRHRFQSSHNHMHAPRNHDH